MTSASDWSIPEPFPRPYVDRVNRVYRWVVLASALFAAISGSVNWEYDALSSVVCVYHTVVLIFVWLGLVRFRERTLLVLRAGLYAVFLGFFVQLVSSYFHVSAGGSEHSAALFLSLALFGMSLFIVGAHTVHTAPAARLVSFSMWLVSSAAACLGLVYTWHSGQLTTELSLQTLRFMIGGSVALGMTTIFSYLYGLQVRLEAQKSLLRHYALTDSLTGLPNRRAFESALGGECALARRHEQPLSLIMLDLDSFKQINDTYGHVTGDQVLKQVAGVLSAAVRASDHPARWGGEEFSIVLPKTSLSEALVLAERLRSAVEGYDFKVGTVTASVGVAQLGHGDSPRTLFRRADLALFRAKERGKNRVEVDGGKREYGVSGQTTLSR